MNGFKEIKPEDIQDNPFKLMDKDWMLVTAKKGDKVNAMTASWGELGYLWNVNVATCFIRQSRFTKEFLEAADTFSLTFYDHPKYAKELGYFGTVSGRDEDKIKKTGFTVLEEENTPYFKEARLVLICQKIAKVPLTEDTFLVPFIHQDWYTKQYEGDYHDIYFGKILKVLIKQ
ncbi:MAG: flavin reductase [Bacilli bacterium]|jgi:flavin reductase (DIM6/NTAB) family NADH-FMN oxidoreductase RutF|nr:flavin reductase [Bacilli bacterium]